MSEPDEKPINWDIKLIFDAPAASSEPAEIKRTTEVKKAEPSSPEIPPRQIIKEKYPRLSPKIELLWGSPELQHFLEQTLFTDRPNRQGFPPDVMSALMKIYAEHTKLMEAKGFINNDVWGSPKE